MVQESVCSFFEHTASDGKKYTIQYYNLDMILSVVYRVKSKRDVEFRKWFYQNVFGQEVYPSIEEKAANLLYFLIKDHPFIDGCKRIGATLFLEFLNKNNHLIIHNKRIISNSALVAITLMIVESHPTEKETMVRLVMNFLHE